MNTEIYNRKQLQRYKRKAFLPRVARKIVGVEKYKRKTYGHRVIQDPQHTNDYIYEKLNENDHIFVARLGDVECRLLEILCQYELKTIDRIPDVVLDIARNNAGIFLNSNLEINRFFSIYKESLDKLTGICVWFNYLEDYIVDSFASNADLLSLLGLDSYLFDTPWTSALKGKKVLVINPFAETIEKQYLNREKIYKNNPDTLPKFEKLLTYKSEMTFAGEKPRFSTWEATLDYMYDNCKSLDFDVAIIGCGGYGLPLGARLFELGKSVIHCGGVTQIFFGVKGKRWENLPYTAKYMNEFWVRPDITEMPGDKTKVENGCYW